MMTVGQHGCPFCSHHVSLCLYNLYVRGMVAVFHLESWRPRLCIRVLLCLGDDSVALSEYLYIAPTCVGR